MKRNTSPSKTTRAQQNVLFWIIIVAAVVAITIGIVGLEHMQSSGNITTSTTTTADWIASGPFSINKQDYASGEKIFFVASGIGYDEKGEAVIERLNGEEALRIPFDGSKSPTINRYFDILSLHDTKCKDCNLGTWKISFHTVEGGLSYPPITFEVTDNVKEIPKIKEEVDK